MKSFRNPKYLERYEDVVFDLEQAINVAPANNDYQERNNHKFISDNRSEVTPFDWYNARIALDFKVQQRDGTNFAIPANAVADEILAAARGNYNTYADNQMGIVNGANSFISRLSVSANGKELDTSRSANKNRFIRRQVGHRKNEAGNADAEGLMLDNISGTYDEGFSKAKALLGTSDIVHCEIPLNRYSFFEALEDKLLPNTKIEINFEIENDHNLIWRTGGNQCRVVITRLQLFVPRLVFNSEGNKIYMSEYLKPYKWTYLNEVVQSNIAGNQRVGNFKITNGISKPRHVFVFKINTANIESQTANPFLYNTFSVSTNSRTLDRCYLDVGNENEYPDIHYKPSSDP